MRRIGGSLLVLVVLGGALASAGPSEEEKIEAVITAVIEAYRTGGYAALGQYYAPEVTVVPSDYSPPLVGWASIEPRYRQAYARLTGAEMTRENTRIVRERKLAWVVYQWRFAGVLGTETVGTQGHTTLILQKRGRQWLIVHNHTSAILPPTVPEETPPPPDSP